MKKHILILLLAGLCFSQTFTLANNNGNIVADSIINYTSRIYLGVIEKSDNKEQLYNYFVQEKEKIDKDPSVQHIVDLPIRMGMKLNGIGFLPEALRIFRTTINYLEEEKERISPLDTQWFELYIQTGITFYGLGDENEALHYYLKAYDVAHTTQWDMGLAVFYNNLSILYGDQGDIEKAEELLMESLVIYEKVNDVRRIRLSYNNMASMYVSSKQYDDAILLFEKALALPDLNDHYLNAVLYTNIGEAYKNKKEYSKALEYEKKAEALLDKTNDEELRLSVFLNLSEVNAKLNNKTQAYHYLRRAIEIIDRIDAPNLTKASYKQIADIYSILGDSASAYHYMNYYVTINDSVNEANTKMKLMNLLSVHEVEKLEFQNKELIQLAQIKELALAKHRYLLISIIIVAILSVIFLVVLFRKTKSEKEKNALIARQRKLMLEQEQVLHQKNVKELQTEIDFQNRQLASYTLNMVAVSGFHQKITQELENTKANSTNQKNKQSAIDGVIKQIKIYGNNFSNEEFKTYFENVHPTFYNNLLKEHPNLTQNDLRLCAFLRLGLSTKEIASLTFREISSVESSRNRLRKKLNLSSDENFQAYLSDF